ncbi:MmpS family transport accessory protein [Mycolicibacterium smegmatis]|uniref:MmpS2 protein n=1 Tax=Mycolicibacterium smegmatis (strain MKD8) TaxID=1214915 RepID=A0A2U9PHI3_MYCSE|nr:MmpS family transport accessory protein [Mycolicibacterium smegmatis]AWT51183.1 MmpS2 protein [Mycolicibacterium smegmatis MKD8]
MTLVAAKPPARKTRERTTARRTVVPGTLQKGWLPAVTVIALGIGSLAVWKVHEMSAPGPVPTVLAAQAPEQFTPKRMTYELFGSPGNGGMLSYVDIDGNPHRIDITELPWSHTETTTLTVVSGSISAQVEGGEVGCRILVNDVVRDERSSTHANADVTCRVKSA